MANQNSEALVPTPQLPQNPSMDIFTLRYNKQTVQTVTFWAKSLKEADALGRKYCETFRLKFIHVGPFCVDLEEIIAAKEKIG